MAENFGDQKENAENTRPIPNNIQTFISSSMILTISLYLKKITFDDKNGIKINLKNFNLNKFYLTGKCQIIVFTK